MAVSLALSSAGPNQPGDPVNEPADTVMTSTLTDVRTAPLGRVAAPGILDRLRPTGAKVVVAAFNSSL
jgi:hypothetical protein